MMFSLAERLGMTRAELGTRLSAAELIRWKALYIIEAEDREKQQR
jgi:hypothetical protein